MANTQASVENVFEMAEDKTAMQDRDVEYAGVTTGGTPLVFNGANASVTNGGLTTVEASSGEITLGRAKKLRLRLSGSFSTNAGASTIELKIQKDTTGVGDAFTDTEFGVTRYLSNGDTGSFAAEFHGTRAIGDLIRVFIVPSVTKTITFSSVSVMTEWMS